MATKAALVRRSIEVLVQDAAMPASLEPHALQLLECIIMSPPAAAAAVKDPPGHGQLLQQAPSQPTVPPLPPLRASRGSPPAGGHVQEAVAAAGAAASDGGWRAAAEAELDGGVQQHRATASDGLHAPSGKFILLLGLPGSALQGGNLRHADGLTHAGRRGRCCGAKCTRLAVTLLQGSRTKTCTCRPVTSTTPTARTPEPCNALLPAGKHIRITNITEECGAGTGSSGGSGKAGPDAQLQEQQLAAAVGSPSAYAARVLTKKLYKAHGLRASTSNRSLRARENELRRPLTYAELQGARRWCRAAAGRLPGCLCHHDALAVTWCLERTFLSTNVQTGRHSVGLSLHGGWRVPQPMRLLRSSCIFGICACMRPRDPLLRQALLSPKLTGPCTSLFFLHPSP